MINKERVLQWVNALESGKYKQASNSLKTPEGMCCLGVACEVSGLSNWEEERGVRADTQSVFTYLGAKDFMPIEVLKYYGFIDEMCDKSMEWCLVEDYKDPGVTIPERDEISHGRATLSTLNDIEKYAFKDLAKVIRDNFLLE